jgi:CheY-like chemotaxis protein
LGFKSHNGSLFTLNYLTDGLAIPTSHFLNLTPGRSFWSLAMNDQAFHSSSEDDSGNRSNSAVLKRLPGTAQPLTVLVVEDSADVRMMMRILLEMEGYRVVEAEDGLRAVELAIAERPALIMMDLHLPLLDGLGATGRIREHLRDVRVVALSGYETPEHRMAALAAGCTDYLVKPLDFKQLDRILAGLAC